MLDRLAYIELLLGRLPDAEMHGLEGLRLAGDLGLDAGVALASMATLHAYRGEEAECRAQAQLAMEVAAARQLRMISAAAQWALGLLELGAGRPAEALAALESVASSTEGHPGILRWATPDLVEAAARSGRPEACAPAVDRLQAWAEASGLPIPAAALARCRGLLASGEEAVRHFEDALRADDQDTRPLERARIQLLLGETLRRSRQRAESRPYLRSAMETFERLGADPWADRARSELRASGESTARRDPAGARAPHAPGASDRAVRRRRRQQRRDRRQALPQPTHGRVPPRQGLHEGRRLVPTPARRRQPASLASRADPMRSRPAYQAHPLRLFVVMAGIEPGHESLGGTHVGFRQLPRS